MFDQEFMPFGAEEGKSVFYVYLCEESLVIFYSVALLINVRSSQRS